MKNKDFNQLLVTSAETEEISLAREYRHNVSRALGKILRDKNTSLDLVKRYLTAIYSAGGMEELEDHDFSDPIGESAMPLEQVQKDIRSSSREGLFKELKRKQVGDSTMHLIAKRKDGHLIWNHIQGLLKTSYRNYSESEMKAKMESKDESELFYLLQVRDEKGKTPLHVAAIKRNLPLIKAIFDPLSEEFKKDRLELSDGKKTVRELLEERSLQRKKPRSIPSPSSMEGSATHPKTNRAGR
jgi:hypothetical protein